MDGFFFCGFILIVCGKKGGEKMQKRFFAPSLTLSALLTLFGSCAAPKVQLDQLAGEWDVVEFDLDTARYEVKNLKEGSAPFFGFNLKEHRFYGSATCNSLMGSFKVDSTQAGSISIPGVASTRAFGPHMDLEQAIVKREKSIQDGPSSRLFRP